MWKHRFGNLAASAIGGIAAIALLTGAANAAVQRGSVVLVSTSASPKILAVSDGEISGTNTVTVEESSLQTFTGVTEIQIFGQGSAEIEVVSHDLVLKTINGTRGVSIKVIVDTPPGAQDVDLDFSFDTGTRSDDVAIEAVNAASNSFDMNIRFDFGTRSSKLLALVENLGSAPTTLDIAGDGGTRDDTLEVIGKGGGLFKVKTRAAMEKNKIEIEGDLEANLALVGESEVIVKGNLCGPVTGAFKVEVEGSRSPTC